MNNTLHALQYWSKGEPLIILFITVLLINDFDFGAIQHLFICGEYSISDPMVDIIVLISRAHTFLYIYIYIHVLYMFDYLDYTAYCYCCFMHAQL